MRTAEQAMSDYQFFKGAWHLPAVRKRKGCTRSCVLSELP